MIELTNLYMFIAASFLLCLAPGPDNIYVLTQGMTKSKKAAIITTLGLCSGIVIHTTAAAFGISVIFKTSEIAFNIVKFAGAAYLIYIAYQAFKYRNTPLDLTVQNSGGELKKLYLKGFFMNILNPKVSIFFLAFLPICNSFKWKCSYANDYFRSCFYGSYCCCIFFYWNCCKYVKFKTY